MDSLTILVFHIIGLDGIDSMDQLRVTNLQKIQDKVLGDYGYGAFGIPFGKKIEDSQKLCFMCCRCVNVVLVCSGLRHMVSKVVESSLFLADCKTCVYIYIVIYTYIYIYRYIRGLQVSI